MFPPSSSFKLARISTNGTSRLLAGQNPWSVSPACYQDNCDNLLKSCSLPGLSAVVATRTVSVPLRPFDGTRLDSVAWTEWKQDTQSRSGGDNQV